jgi:hypothetical protein
VGATTVIGMTMQSANDGPERDPKIVLLEGSNDETIAAFDSGTWEQIVKLDNIPSWETLFGTTNRFKTQEFAFPNKKSYKHYRFTVLETQTVNGCCFQMAEVELLAVTERVDCEKARFLVQPTDTAVLEGATARFNVTLNGPWPIQWYKNGERIPGATATSYTTDAVTAANATNVYTAQIVGCEVSSPAMAVIFKPSATKSIGINFIGGGANGSPTAMLSNDVTGLVPQAYWNNITAATGASADLTDPLADSDNQATSVTFEWASSGNWGAGTGDASPLQRQLNGLIYANPGSPGKLTFGNVPNGTHAVIAYTVGIPLQFQNADYKVTGKTETTYYTRVLNADEYNAAPGFFRGSSTDAKARTLSSFVRFDNVSPAADGTIVLEWNTLTTGFDRGAPVNAIQLVLNAPAAGTPPSITESPEPAVAEAGGSVTLSVKATGENLTYQWRKGGKNLPNGGNISGATSPTLVIRSITAADEAIYSVGVFNASGSALSQNASVRVSKFDIKENLVADFKFDETSGSTAANAATGGVAGKVMGAAAWGGAQIGNGFKFDGASYVMVDNYTKAKKQLAVSAWVKVDAGAATDVAFVRNAIGQLGIGAGAGPGTPAGQFELGLVYNADEATHRLTAAVGAGPNIARATSSGTFSLGAWHHVAFSVDGAQLRLYLDGQEVAEADNTADINTPEMPWLSIGARLANDTSEPPVLGPDGTNPNYLSGQLDDLAIWTRGLTGGEAKAIYDAGKAGKDVTTVIPPKPTTTVAPEFATTKIQDNKIVLSWTGTGTLEQADAVNGAYAAVPEVTGQTYSIDTTKAGAAKFYRLKQ